jgi:hypothetical protein
MTNPILLVSTWSSGLFVVAGRAVRRELAGRQVQGLVAADDGSVLAIVDQHRLCRRDPGGAWTDLARSESPLSSCLRAGADIFVGTDDGAHVLRLDGDVLRLCEGFDATPGRDQWYAGAMLVDGKLMGPPLGIRSMSAACDGSILFANVHVGGLPRSTDGGATWHPTVDVEADVHEVACHPSRPGVVAAAAAVGLCLSHDGGVTWRIETDGLHEPHCSAVAFVGDDIFVSASKDPFDPKGAVYRRSVDGAGALTLVGGGLPERTAGKVDTGGICARGASAAIVDFGGTIYLSADAGRTWVRHAGGAAGPSGAVFI